MVALWYRASQYLGPMWEAQFGGVNDDTIYAWQEALRHLSEAEIANGVNELARWSEKYPPTLGKFRELCKSGPPAPSAPQLEHRYDAERAREAARRELPKMLAIVHGESEMTYEEAIEFLGLDKR